MNVHDGPGCVVCGRPVLASYRPFCSRRCGDVDLARWLGGDYRIAVNTPDEDDEAAPEATSDVGAPD